MSAYEVKPGTVAYKAVAYLQTLPEGAEVISSVLAENVYEAPANMTPALLEALKNKALFRRQKDARHSKSPFFWSLVDHEAAKKANGSNGHNGAALEIPTTHDIGAGIVEQSAAGRELVKAWTGGFSGSAIGSDLKAWPKVESPAVQEQIKYVQAKVAEARKESGLRMALWSDGTLQIQRGGSEMVLSPQETQQLVDYIGLVMKGHSA